MAPSFLSSGGNAAKIFQIRLDNNNLILNGNANEASSALLKGSLVLCLSEPLRVHNVHLELTGVLRLDWSQQSGLTSAGSHAKQEREFFRRDWWFVGRKGKSQSQTLPADNHEWRFEDVVPGNMQESVEGLPHSWVIYRMKATIDRPGILQKALHDRKHVRIIRTYDPNADEVANAMSVENVWPDKIQYAISVPNKGVIFGTPITVDFTLVPLLKGLKIGKISTELLEMQEITPNVNGGTRYGQYKGTRVVAQDEWQIPADTEAEDIGGQEGWMFQRAIAIPKSLGQCVQTVDAFGLRVRHRLRFNIQLHNPDEHTSELRATLPVHVFISPNLPLDDNNNMIDQRTPSFQELEELGHAPPLYEQHHFDQLYSSVDPSGYITPAPEAHTPSISHSRIGSVDDLTSMAAAVSGNFSANVLQNRLSNLQNRELTRGTQGCSHTSVDNGSSLRANFQVASEDEIMLPGPVSMSDFQLNSGGIGGRNNNSNLLSRHPSEEERSQSGVHTPQHIEFNAQDLAKVPSYLTAMQAPTRTPIFNGLPTYQTATSRPPSPTSALPQAPVPVYTHTTRSSPDSTSSTVTLLARTSQLNQPVQRDEERRLRTAQARGRH